MAIGKTLWVSIFPDLKFKLTFPATFPSGRQSDTFCPQDANCNLRKLRAK